MTTQRTAAEMPQAPVINITGQTIIIPLYPQQSSGGTGFNGFQKTPDITPEQLVLCELMLKDLSDAIIKIGAIIKSHEVMFNSKPTKEDKAALRELFHFMALLGKCKHENWVEIGRMIEQNGIGMRKTA